jgi:hypothetical protein
VDAQPGDNPRGEGGGTPSLSRRMRLWPRSDDIVLVVCCRTGHGNTHAGAVFRSTEGRWMLFHQAWHEITLYEALDDALVDMSVRGFVFAAVEYPSAIMRNFLRICRSIASRRHTIPFAFGLDDAAVWDEATRELHMPHGRGLTCVNFVLSLFRTAGLPVIEPTGWPLRSDDEAFQRGALQALEATCRQRSGGLLSDPQRRYLEEVRNEIDSGCARIRSEELVGALLHSEARANHEIAIPAGAVVCRIVDAALSTAGQ